MIIENKRIEGKSITWMLRYPTKYDAILHIKDSNNTTLLNKYKE